MNSLEGHESADAVRPEVNAPAELPEDVEARRWLTEVYQGDRMRQLSVRSIVTGMLIGGVMSISNLYVGLKTGWGLGVTVTACIIAYAVFRFLETLFARFRNDPFTILENYTMSSAASAAGYMSSAGLVSAIPALYLITGRVLSAWEMMAWLGAVSVLGVFMAIPLKRQMINIDQLPFPTGIATAETLKGMHGAGAGAIRKARALGGMALVGAAVKVWQDGPAILSGLLTWLLPKSSLGGTIANWALPEILPFWRNDWARDLVKTYTLGLESSTIMVAAGAIMGIRVGVSLLIGAVIYYGILGPWLIDQEMIASTGGYKAIVAWTLWPASAMMVTSGLLSFALRWRTVVRAVAGLAAVVGRKSKAADPLAEVEVPGWWFVAGTVVSGAACVLLGHFLFQITWWMGVLAVLLTFLLSIVAARATGETDVTPIGAMGKITQLTYGILAPPSPMTSVASSMTTNLMTASITAGAASHSADLLTDLKSGYLLGGNPRYQTISQLFGVLAGTLFCVPVYAIIVKTPPKTDAAPAAAVAKVNPGEEPVVEKTNLGEESLPAPSAKVWAAVAEMVAKGVDGLPSGAVAGMIVGGLLGILLTLGEEFLPRSVARWLPSAIGLGIAGVVPAFNSISMFLGAAIAWLWGKLHPKTAEEYVIAGSSGLIAGESLTGVLLILLVEGPKMFHALFG